MIAYIVIHYGDDSLLKNFLSSFQGDFNSLYVVLNGTDLTVENIERLKIIRLEKNMGFSCAVNAGIKKAIEEGFKWFLVLNNDVVFKDDFFTKIGDVVKRYQDKKVALSPLILFEDGKRIWFAKGEFSKWTGTFKHKYFNEEVELKSDMESDYLTGCAMFIPKEAVEECGYFDEDYFLYWEDVDYSIRLKKRNFKFFVVPEIQIIHLGSQTTKLESPLYIYYFFRNNLLFFRKNFGPLMRSLYYFFFFLKILKLALVWSLFYGKDGFRKVFYLLKGSRDFFCGIKGVSSVK